MPELERIPPHSIEAEQALLGAMLLSREACAIGTAISDDEYWHPQHALIHKAIRELFGSGKPVDLTTVAALLASWRKFEDVGGGEYLVHLTSLVPTARNAEQYAEIVHAKAGRRKLIAIAEDLQAAAYDACDDDAAFERAEKLMANAMTPLVTGEAVPARELAGQTYDAIEQRTREGRPIGHSYPWSSLTRLCRLVPTELVVFGGDASVGKTSWAGCVALHTALKCGLRTLIVSLEMTRNEVMEMLICQRTPYNSQLTRAGRVGDGDWSALWQSTSELAESPLYVWDDEPTLNPRELFALSRKHASRHGLDVLIVDHIQRMEPLPGRRDVDMHAAAADAARVGKSIAMALNCCVIMLCQLRKQKARGEGHNKRPAMADLWGGAGIQTEANVILLGWREHYDMDEPWDGRVDTGQIAVAKNRSGPTGVVRMNVDLWTRRWIEPGD